MNARLQTRRVPRPSGHRGRRGAGTAAAARRARHARRPDRSRPRSNTSRSMRWSPPTSRAASSATSRKDDFQVFEDGKPQTIANFSLVNIPVEQAAAAALRRAADRAGRAVERTSVRRPRLRDGPRRPARRRRCARQRVKTAARQFIERNLGANDLMAVIFTGGRSQERRSSRATSGCCSAAVDKFMGRKLPSPTISPQRASTSARSTRRSGATDIPDPYEQERVYNAQSMLSHTEAGGANGSAASAAAARRCMLVSEGIDYDIYGRHPRL